VLDESDLETQESSFAELDGILDSDPEHYTYLPPRKEGDIDGGLPLILGLGSVQSKYIRGSSRLGILIESRRVICIILVCSKAAGQKADLLPPVYHTTIRQQILPHVPREPPVSIYRQYHLQGVG
jgi:hypothetical protein